MKNSMLMVLCILILVSATVAVTDIPENETGDISGIADQITPLVVIADPPPGDALDILVNEGYMTSEERDLFWDAYNEGVDEAEKSSILEIALKICKKIAGQRKPRITVQKAIEELAEWVCDNISDSSGGSSGPCTACQQSYQQPLEN
ncbi:MAG: hypothetical protein R3F48_03790 [Candidatus Zixiibacteriota bacterium]